MGYEISPLRQPAADPLLWKLDPEVVFLNHGSFGACPRAVLEYQQVMRDRMERQPLQFLARELEGLLDHARASLAAFVGADPDCLVYVPSATAGVNTVLRSLEFKPGDELLVTDQEYNACRNALNYAAERTGARVVAVPIPFPLENSGQIVDAVLAAVTPKTRLALLDHVVSQTGLVLPMERLVAGLQAKGVDCLVDGAHSPGMIPLNLNALGAAYYTGNCHKWLCAPKGSAFLHVRKDLQQHIRPLVISHGANTSRTDRSKFLVEFGWAGTSDPSACLAVPEAIKFMASLLPGGWRAVMERNRALALAGRDILCAALRIPAPCPDEFVGSTAAVPLPDSPAERRPILPAFEYPLQVELRTKHQIEVPMMPWPAPPKRLLRISAQLYNSTLQYDFLAVKLLEGLSEELG